MSESVSELSVCVCVRVCVCVCSVIPYASQEQFARKQCPESSVVIVVYHAAIHRNVI